VCINKMDLADYNQQRFDELVKEFNTFADQIRFPEQEIEFVPVSSLHGENITRLSEQMPWYTGKPLLEILENMEVHKRLHEAPARFPVQYVIRPRNEEHHDFRGYAGRVSGGFFTVGDEIIVLPSLQKTVITGIQQFESQLTTADARQSVVFTLKTDVDISRGDVIVKAAEQFEPRKELESEICWMDNQPLISGKTYLLQHGTGVSKAKVTSIDYVQIPSTLEKKPTDSLQMNDIAHVKLKTAKPIAADAFDKNPSNGAFILVDEYSNKTVAVGFVR